MKINPIFAALILITVLALAGLITVVVLEIDDGEGKRPVGSCSVAHEDYGNSNSSEGVLGQYDKYAVSADNLQCSTVGK
jgi:hypothetical protein